MQFWEKAHIPTMLPTSCERKLKKVYEQWRNLQKSSGAYQKARTNEEKFSDKIENYIFDIAAPYALEKIKIKEDRDFLLHQRMRGRPGVMIGIDANLARKEERRIKRLQEEEKRVSKQKSQAKLALNVSNGLTSEEETTDNENETSVGTQVDNLSTLQDDLHAKNSRGTINFIDDRMLSSMDKCKLSTRDAMHIVTATVAAILNKVEQVPTNSITLKDLVINRTTIHSMRKNYRRKQAAQIIQEFKIPEVFVLHWDGKLLPEVKGIEKVERLSLVITSEGVEKLLGIPKIESSSGENISDTIYNFLCKWKLSSLVEIVSFDTTASNTGIRKGSAYMLERKLGRNLLFLPCRHHISELLVKAVFELNFGVTSGPEVLLFNRFAKEWKNIDVGIFKSGILDKEVANILTKPHVENIKSFCLNALKSNYARADYKELLQLTLHFIGVTVPNFSQFRFPGATSHARFMSKCIFRLINE